MLAEVAAEYRYTPPAGSSAGGTVGWAFENFMLDARARDLSEASLEWYHRKIRPFVAYLVEQGVARMNRLQFGHAQGYLLALRDGGKSPANIIDHGRAARAFLYWAGENELIDPAIPRRFKLPRRPKIERDVFTTADIAALVAACKQTTNPERNAAMVLLMADTGLRAGEVGRIAESECEFDRILIHGKGRRERYVPIAPHTRKALQRWRKKRGSSEWLFVTVRDEVFDRQTVYKVFRRLGEIAGISPCHPHMMRRATATEWIKAGGDSFSLQALLGHSSQVMTAIYAKMADSTVAEKHRHLSLVERLETKKHR